MKDLDEFPKSIKKAVRYIKQDTTKEQLEEISHLIHQAIMRRRFMLTHDSHLSKKVIN
ncbi:hypothetical protein JNUCC23_19365 [Peribacillus sp. JNUCC 23]